MKINTSRKAGFTLVEIMIVVAIIGLLAAIAIPNFVKARETSRTNACINNLRQIEGAKQQWAFEEKQPAIEARAVRHGDSLAAKSEKQQLQPPCFRAAVDHRRIEVVDGWFTRDRCARGLLPP